jgi:hypothetical protein
LFLDLKEFFLKKYDRSTIVGFINYDHGKYKQSIVEWFEGFDSFKDAEESFFKKFTTVYAETCPNSQKKFNNGDLSPLFVEAQLNKRAMIEGTKTLDRAIRAASRRAKRSLSERSKASSSTSGTGSIGNEQPTSDLLMVYIENCKQIARKRGFNIETEMHKLLYVFQQPAYHLANTIYL